MTGYRKRSPAKREEHIFCPIVEEKFYLRDCFSRYFAARNGKGKAYCAGCKVVAARIGELPKMKIMQALKARAPYYVDLSAMAKAVGQRQTELETTLRAMTAAGVIDASLVYCRGATNARKIYRLKLDPNAQVDVEDEASDE